MHPLSRIGSLLTATILCLLFVVVTAGSAFGVTPLSSGQTIVSEGFEAATVPQYTATPLYMTSNPPPAWWGPTGRWYRSGLRSLWCAGSNTTRTTYPAGTAGLTTFDLPQLADYYSATASFWYTEPSIGSADTQALNIYWGKAGDWRHDAPHFLPTTSSWLSVSYELSSPSNEVNLSRASGMLGFQFISDADLGTTGRGPSIDDVVIRAYKYGPVRSLTATRSGDTVALSWAAPYASTASTVEDTRTIAYRVWRAAAGTDIWTELTAGGRTAATSLADVTTSPGVAYKYVVQAWDPGNGDGRGEHSSPVEWSSPQVQATLTAPSKPSGTVYMWTSFTSGGSIEPTHAGPTTVDIECSRNKSTVKYRYAANVAAGSTTYSAVNKVKLPMAGTWYIRARHSDSTHGTSYSSWTAVTVSGYIRLYAPSVRTTMYRNRAYTVYGYIIPRHTSSYLRVYAYRWNGRRYAYSRSFLVRVTNSGQPAYRTKYTASVKLPYKGYWKLRAKHSAHTGEATKYSAYSVRIRVK